ncbi:uncharacterized protein RAG0_04722 [Rhynchosporium agropyri]|uniref:Uncharacterized protein n=1 Tax=Rhynchosporium agropyri TaxID=914238 RepID=A0A1E1KA04_9HELO|nr:uncharacterized protein RAG0_04722 [Rhynchosporium agropyri]
MEPQRRLSTRVTCLGRAADSLESQTRQSDPGIWETHDIIETHGTADTEDARERRDSQGTHKTKAKSESQDWGSQISDQKDVKLVIINARFSAVLSA